MPHHVSVSSYDDVDPRRYIGYLLRWAYVRAAGCAQECLSGDVAPREIGVLAVLAEHGPMSQRRLAEMLRVHQSVLVGLVDNVESSGWAVRARSEQDRRSYVVQITPEGTAALEGFIRSLDESEARFTAALSKRERARLNSLLRRLLGDEESTAVESLARRSGYLIARAHRRLRDKAIASLRPLGIHPRDFGVLTIVASHEGCSQQQLAAALRVSPPAALGFVDELEAAGLIARTRNPTDRRAYELSLTGAGRDCLEKALAAAAELQSEVVAALGEDGDQALRGLLVKLVA